MSTEGIQYHPGLRFLPQTVLGDLLSQFQGFSCSHILDEWPHLQADTTYQLAIQPCFQATVRAPRPSLGGLK